MIEGGVVDEFDWGYLSPRGCPLHRWLFDVLKGWGRMNVRAYIRCASALGNIFNDFPVRILHGHWWLDGDFLRASTEHVSWGGWSWRATLNDRCSISHACIKMWIFFFDRDELLVKHGAKNGHAWPYKMCNMRTCSRCSFKFEARIQGGIYPKTRPFPISHVYNIYTIYIPVVRVCSRRASWENKRNQLVHLPRLS